MHSCSRRFGMVVCVLLLASGLRGEEPGAKAAAGLHFYSDVTVAYLDSTRVIPIAVDPLDKNRSLECVIDVGEARAAEPIFEVIRQPQVLAGYGVGYLRIRTLSEGEATLRIGDAKLRVQVKRSPVHELTHAHPPMIHTPVHGAAVWDRFSVGAWMFDDPTQVRAAPRWVWLETSDGQKIDPKEWTSLRDGPMRRIAFELNAREVKPGPLRLVVKARGADGQIVSSEPVDVQVMRPDGKQILAGEAEDQKDVVQPEGYQQKPLNIGQSIEAAGDHFVNNSGSQPTLTIPFNVEKEGWYQLALRVAADPAGGMLPMVGFRTGERREARTASMLAGAQWHRLIVGRPIRFEPGQHQAMPYFENDFNAGRAGDRNLRIDRWELLRLDKPPVPDLEDENADTGYPGFAVALDPSLHGRVVGADFIVNVHVRWPERLQKHPPMTELLVNGKAVSQQASKNPRFDVAAADLKTGANVLQLRSKLDRGAVVSSTEATVVLLEHPAPRVAAKSMRFPMSDSAWGEAKSLGRDPKTNDDPVMLMYSNSQADLELGQEFKGKYVLQIDARGDEFDGAPIAVLSLVVDGAEPKELGRVEVAGGYKHWSFGEVELPEGKKRLRVAFINDKYDAARGDRNLYMKSLLVQEPGAAQKDTAPPAVKLIYPVADQSVSGQDAAIALVSDDRAIGRVELLIDDQPTGVFLDQAHGRVLLPVSWRGVEPGTHKLAVRATDRANNAATSEAVSVKLLGPDSAELTHYERAVRLLDRFAFGPDPDALADVLTVGEHDYLARCMRPMHDDPGDNAAWALAMLRYPNDYSGGDVVRRTIDHAMTTPNPVRARLALLLDNHFTTWQRKAGSERKAAEYDRLLHMTPAPFQELLMNSATSAAMLRYLDQQNSFGRRINENYAREIMELHSLGVHAGYTQQDVTELANLITGWREDSMARLDGGRRQGYTFIYDPALNDPSPRVVFGMAFDEAEPEQRYDRARQAIEMLATHPEAARFIATKLIEHYAAPPADPKLVDRLAGVFHRTGGDVGAMVLTLAEDETFLAATDHRRLTRPIDYGLRISRTTGRYDAGLLQRYLEAVGVGMFDRDTPDGYPEEDVAYADSNATLQRWRTAQSFGESLARTLPPSLRRSPEKADDAQLAAYRDALVDQLAIRLAGRRLTVQSHAAVVDLLAKSNDVKPKDVPQFAATLVAQMPESSLR